MSKTVSHGPHIMIGLLADQPFSAKVEMTSEETGARHTGFLAQDSHGRSRYEIAFASGLSVISICDPVGEKRYTFNTGTKEVREEEYPRAQQMWSEKIPEPQALTEKRVIEGLECFRKDFSQRGGEHGERRVDVTAWISPRVGLVAEEAVEDGKKNTWRLYEISLSEPDPKLFERPELPR